MIVLNALFPVLALIVSGVLLRYFSWTDKTFLQTADRLVYFICFPLLLFWKIGSASYEQGIDWNYCLAALLAILLVFLLSLILFKPCGVTAYKAGSFCQSCFRFNTYIGVAVILGSFGDEGLAYFGLLIGIVIPIINVLSVSVLIWNSGINTSHRERFGIASKALLTNPPILGCLAGLAYSQLFNGFAVFIENTLQLISTVSLPLALISIGGTLSFAGVSNHLKLSSVAAVVKLCILPLIGYLFFRIFGVTGLALQVGLVFFALPTSTAIYVLSAQLNSDTELASSSIVLSTVLSAISLSVVLLLV